MIHLDLTLADLYKREGLDNLIYIPHYPSSSIDFGDTHPRNRKFHINDVHRSNIPTELPDEERRSLALQFTIGDMLRLKFFLGNIDVLRICSRGCPPQPLQGECSLSIPNRVDPTQVPKRITNFFVDDANVNPLAMLESMGRRIILPFPHDWCSSLPHLVAPDLHYLFHSKAYLTRIPVNVPQQEVFSLDARLIHGLEARPAPFVVKSTHGACGTGTWLVSNEADRQNMLGALRQLRDPRNDSSWGEKIVVSDFIDATHNFCVHFFVGRTGRSEFLGVTEQTVDAGFIWQGTIEYKRQKALKALFHDITDSIAQALAEDGYIGPAGADILIDRSGKQWLIDLNPRINGGTPLCMMRQHFSVQRKLHHAALLLAVRFRGTSAEFASAFEPRLDKSQVIVLTLKKWRDVRTGSDGHACTVMCAGRTEGQVKAIVEEIRDYCKGTLMG